MLGVVILIFTDEASLDIATIRIEKYFNVIWEHLLQVS